ncbi:hypothetical protein HELRODRAFT_179674 [Helobdella robusta]|uniref:Uncharacterized protein n=1 Tax=Helobdella robusta TaxID=6412 RepID=T1FF07_HELRO|nr:hypothetical protein HELRODRAFT_179674 [Helobdella robusta]ESN95089.1 hypothetical protein HELRODRAFT_179674 [Helobdella robusta]
MFFNRAEPVSSMHPIEKLPTGDAKFLGSIVYPAAYLPRFIYFRRTSPGHERLILQKFDLCPRSGFENISNVAVVNKTDAAATVSLQNSMLPNDKNDFLVCCFQKAAISVVKDPVGLIADGGNFRPDSHPSFPWAMRRSLAWDVTFHHTMAKRYISFTSVEAGTAPTNFYTGKHHLIYVTCC